MIEYVEHREYRRKKKLEATKRKRRRRRNRKKKKSGPVPMACMMQQDIYIKKKKTELNVFLHVLKALQINTSFAFDARANNFTIR